MSYEIGDYALSIIKNPGRQTRPDALCHQEHHKARRPEHRLHRFRQGTADRAARRTRAFGGGARLLFDFISDFTALHGYASVPLEATEGELPLFIGFLALIFRNRFAVSALFRNFAADTGNTGGHTRHRCG